MNYKYLLSSLAAAAMLAAGCAVEPIGGDLEEIQIDNTIILLSDKGGSVTASLTAKDAWHLDENTLNVVEFDNPEDPENPIMKPWLTVSPASGEAGEFKITFSAEAAALDRADTISFICGSAEQQVIVNQPGDPSLRPQYDPFEAGEYWIMIKEGSTWKAAKPVGASDSYGYLYTQAAVEDDGVLSSTAANVFTFTASGDGFTIQDASGRYYYMSGSYDSFNVTTEPSSGHVWKVEQTGDQAFTIVNASNAKTIQYDPKYSSFGAYDSMRDNAIMPYLVKAEAPAPELITIAQTEWTVQRPAGVLDIPATIAGNVSVDTDADWLSFVGVKYIDGVTNLEFNYTENTGSESRTATVDVNATDGVVVSTVVLTINQTNTVELPELPETGTASDPYSVSSANAIFDANAWSVYSEDKAYFKGIISKIVEVEVEKYHNANFYISADGTEEGDQLYIYHCKYLDDEGFTSEDQIEIGDEVVICGSMDVYNTTEEIVDCYIHSINGVAGQPSLTVGEATKTVDAAAESVVFSYSAKNLSGAVTAVETTDESNIISAVSVDEASSTVNVTLIANTEEVEKTATITLSANTDGVGDVTLTVIQKAFSSTAVEEQATFDFAALGLENGTEFSGVSQKDIVITAAVGSNQYGNVPKYYEGDGTARVYVGNTLTVSGATIKSIAFTFERGADLFSTETGSYSSETATWTGENDAVTFTCSGTARIQKIVVTYTK